MIVILNCDKNLVNGMSYKFANALKDNPKSLVASQNVKEFGVNLIGSQFHVLEILEPLILNENKNELQPYLDKKGKYFGLLDECKHTLIFGKIIFQYC